MKNGDAEVRMLFVTADASRDGELSSVFSEMRLGKADFAHASNEARRMFQSRPYNAVMIEAPVKGGSWLTLALDLGRSGSASVLVMLPNEFMGSSATKLSENGILVMPASRDRQIISVAFTNISALHRRMLTFAAEAETLRTKMEELKLVNRAKLILMQRLKMTEAESHKYIEKCAMDSSLKKRDIAENIIRTYED